VSIELWMGLVAFVIALPVTFLLRLPTKAGRGPDFIRVPRIGGFSIFSAFIAAPVVMALVSPEARHYMGHDWGKIVALALCGGVVFLVGAVDDFHDLSWRTKFSTQIGAAIVLYIAGYRVGEMTLPGGDTVSLGLFDPIVTVFWLVLITNAMNLIDGRDGVAAGVSAMVSATMAYVAYDLGHDLIALLFAALAGGSLGFVPLNLPQARRFLGDSGAYFVGFTMGALSVAGFVDTTGRVPLYIPLVALGLPVLDTGLAYLRRYLDGAHPFEPDNDHMHDRVQRLFALRPMHVVAASYAVTAVFCGAALLLHGWYKSVGSAVVGAVVLLFAIGLLATLGYVRSMWNSARLIGLRGRLREARQES
jgi:UDP-GlcNAc:undecaprenyl-phosphate/decaprenyl-phosphate GlcNAc-1-phosphate transferase